MMSTTVADALRAGDLSGALAIVTDRIKREPGSPDARWLMAEILLAQGNCERADRVLDGIPSGNEPNLAVLEFRHLLRAEVVRIQVVREGRAPKFQGDAPTIAQQVALRARMLLRLGDVCGAAEAAEEAERCRERTPGKLEYSQDHVSTFSDLRDADDLMAAEFEVLTTAGDHMLLPASRVKSLNFDAPRRLRDHIWRRCSIELKDGTEGIVYMPAIYLSARAETDTVMLLGRATDWTEKADGPIRGRGLRTLIFDSDALPFTVLRKIEFD